MKWMTRADEIADRMTWPQLDTTAEDTRLPGEIEGT